MFIDYQSSVLQDYQKKKDDNNISSRLINPTPAKLKAESIAVCEERYAKKDERFLRDFFGKQDDHSAYIQAIKKHDTDKFKPLVKFLRGQVEITDEKNIELLAWLINFERRPFDHGERYDVAETGEEPGIQVNDNVEPQKIIMIPPASSGEPKSRLKIRAAIIFIILIMSIGASGYWVLRTLKIPRLTGAERCMYWAGDHYEQVSCNQKFQDTLIVAYDSVKLNTFKKITSPDTITEKSKGKVWYIKIDNKIEFYTSDGFHPILINRRLKPLTDYIIYRYVHQR